jgi:hypothetical protein
MKKVIYGLAIILSIASCQKEDAKQCNCGLVVSDDASNYSVVIRNNCSNNQQTFTLLPGDWMNAYVGSNYCLSNVSSW